jgi:hypothetical protein
VVLPATTNKFLTSWQTNKKESGNEVFFKTFKKTCELKSCTLHRFERHTDTVSRGEKKNKKNTFLDIELTAVLRDLKTKNESNRIEDLNKPLDLQSK